MVRMATYDKRRRTARKIPRGRAKRPKTFKSEATAKKYAETNAIKNYKLVDISTTHNKPKIKIVQE